MALIILQGLGASCANGQRHSHCLLDVQEQRATTLEANVGEQLAPVQHHFCQLLVRAPDGCGKVLAALSGGHRIRPELSRACQYGGRSSYLSAAVFTPNSAGGETLASWQTHPERGSAHTACSAASLPSSSLASSTRLSLPSPNSSALLPRRKMAAVMVAASLSEGGSFGAATAMVPTATDDRKTLLSLAIWRVVRVL